MPKTTPIKPRCIKRETTLLYVRVPEAIWSRFPAKYPQAKRFFPNKTQAQHFCDELVAVQRSADALATGLTEAQNFEAAQCFARLASRNRSLREATDFFLAHLDTTERSIEVGALVEEFFRAKKDAGFTDEYIAPMASRLRALAKDYPTPLPPFEMTVHGNQPNATATFV